MSKAQSVGNLTDGRPGGGTVEKGSREGRGEGEEGGSQLKKKPSHGSMVHLSFGGGHEIYLSHPNLNFEDDDDDGETSV